MTTWTELLDDYEATIVALEAASAAGDELSTATWLPPADVPDVAPTEEDRDRFDRLQERAAACIGHLRSAMAAAESDLDTVRRTGVAARAYGRVEHLAGS
jgi:hypothetical protein